MCVCVWGGVYVRACLYVCMNETVVCRLTNYKLFHTLVGKYRFHSKSVLMKTPRWNITVKQSELSKLKGTEGKSCSPICLMILETKETGDGRYQHSASLALLTNCSENTVRYQIKISIFLQAQHYLRLQQARTVTCSSLIL